MNYVRRLSTPPLAPALSCLCPEGTGQNFPISNEILGTSSKSVRSFGPLSSGPFPNGIRQTGDLDAPARYRELEPLPGGRQRTSEIAARFPLCATFPTRRGDKFTDAELPPQLPLLRDSKSFVKRISPVAPGGPNSRRNLAAAPPLRRPQVAHRLNVAYPQAGAILHRPAPHPTRCR